MYIEAVGSLILMIGIAYLLWYLQKSGKQILHQRELEANRARASASKSTRVQE